MIIRTFDGDRNLSEPWSGVTQFKILNAKPSDGYMWPGMSKAAQRQEKQQWAIEKPKLDNARKLRGIYFIDPDDKEFKETMKKARKKLELPLEAANSTERSRRSRC